MVEAVDHHRAEYLFWRTNSQDHLLHLVKVCWLPTYCPPTRTRCFNATVQSWFKMKQDPCLWLCLLSLTRTAWDFFLLHISLGGKDRSRRRRRNGKRGRKARSWSWPHSLEHPSLPKKGGGVEGVTVTKRSINSSGKYNSEPKYIVSRPH